MKTENQDTCRCERSTCGCQPATTACRCGDDCRCERTCRCGDTSGDGGCACGERG